MPAIVRKPSRIAFSFLVFFGVYPLVTGLSYALQPLTPHWQIWQRNLLVVPAMVLVMVFVLIPAIHALLSRLDTAH
jgi:antibiotic biosynthesis monooxygenase (ABM) superfamily enzyme